jgi:hypothetical protein
VRRARAAFSASLILPRAERTLETLSADIEAGRTDVVAIGLRLELPEVG